VSRENLEIARAMVATFNSRDLAGLLCRRRDSPNRASYGTEIAKYGDFAHAPGRSRA
jgi:hypothetical protein